MRKSLIALGLAACAVPMALLARPVTYVLPPEKIPAALTADDAAPVVNNCASCHSLEYIVTQPRHKGAQFWKDAVTKMVNVYKAPLDQAQADEVASVLARKFG